MDPTLEQLSKEFDIQFFEKHKWSAVRGTVSRTLKAAKRIARRSQVGAPGSKQPQPQPYRWRLPFELIEQIIDHLHDDSSTLRSCALLCLALVDSVQRYLFHRVLVTIKNFLEGVVLFVRNPRLTEHVRELYFEGGEGTAFEALKDMLEQKPPPKHLRVFAQVIAPRLPNVVRLTLKDVPFDQSIVDMFSTPFPRLHTLSLFDCWFRSRADFNALVKGHPLVHSLRCGRLCSLYGASDQTLGEQAGTTQLALRALKISEAYSSSPLTLMPWLLTHVEPETFIYGLYRLSQVAKVNHSINGYAALRHLHLIFYRWRIGDTKEVVECPQALALTPHYPPNLTTLTLDAKTDSLLLVVHTLAQLDPHLFVRLRTVTVLAHVEPAAVDAVDAEAWAGMDQTLSVLLSLGAVRFANVCKDPAHVDAGAEAIVKRLPVLNVRKLLSFSPERPPSEL
ncbi:hypothetical protein C8Q77DRAFT_1120207 [Trametes polyzona]|nr:hypothetical protein C8Q77DRAFT_1120207 [Trametes polyzona]